MSPLRTPEQVRAELRRKGISISQWARANGFSTSLVYEVLAGRVGSHGQSHKIAVSLGIKDGEIVTNPADIARALDRRAA